MEISFLWLYYVLWMYFINHTVKWLKQARWKHHKIVIVRAQHCNIIKYITLWRMSAGSRGNNGNNLKPQQIWVEWQKKTMILSLPIYVVQHHAGKHFAFKLEKQDCCHSLPSVQSLNRQSTVDFLCATIYLAHLEGKERWKPLSIMWVYIFEMNKL